MHGSVPDRTDIWKLLSYSVKIAVFAFRGEIGAHTLIRGDKLRQKQAETPKAARYDMSVGSHYPGRENEIFGLPQNFT